MNWSSTAVIIVVHLILPVSPALAQAPTFVAVSERTIGAVDGPAALSFVGDIAVDEDGYVYVLQPREATVRVFDPSGAPVLTIGRSGAGPGEFMMPGQVALRGDTVSINDVGARRLSWFDRDGSFLNSIHFQTPVDPRYAPAWPHTPLSEGSFVSLLSAGSHVLQSGLVDTNFLLRTDVTGAVRDTLAELRVERSVFVLPHGRGGGETHAIHPLPQTSLWAADPAGESVVVVHRPPPVSSSLGRFEILRIDAAGDTIWRSRFRYGPLRMTEARRDRLIAERAEPYEGSRAFETFEQAVRAVEEHMDLPEYLPPVMALRVADDGTIWLRREVLDDPLATWHVIDAGGRRVVRTVLVPRDAKVQHIANGAVWAVVEDELGVPFVVQYRLERR